MSNANGPVGELPAVEQPAPAPSASAEDREEAPALDAVPSTDHAPAIGEEHTELADGANRVEEPKAQAEVQPAPEARPEEDNGAEAAILKVEEVPDTLSIAKVSDDPPDVEMKEESPKESIAVMAREKVEQNELEVAVQAAPVAQGPSSSDPPSQAAISTPTNDVVAPPTEVEAEQTEEKKQSEAKAIHTPAPEESKDVEEIAEIAPEATSTDGAALRAGEAEGEGTTAPSTTFVATNSVEASAESSAHGARRSSVPRVSIETQQKARQDEAMRIQRENEDLRLMWLSLPANDHITYYSDTEEDASSSTSDANGVAPAGTFGGLPYLSGKGASLGNNRKRTRQELEDERESSDSDDENLDQEELRNGHQYRTGNRGNKLLKGSRWIRRGKLGLWTEAKIEKEMHDRLMIRVKAIQRAGVESLLHNAPGPKVIHEDGLLSRDMLEGSDRLLLRDVNNANVVEENLQSTSLAPALLRPILSARALLESHTLRHTFRNPHIGALSKTALDLRESEGQLSRALGRCFAAMERTSAYVQDAETGEMRVNGSQSSSEEMDAHVIGSENTAGTADEVNPALYRLESLFITNSGLPIPVPAEGEASSSQPPREPQAVLSTMDQRNVVRAALECLQDLATDSLEYVERLDEVRGRLESVKRTRTKVWEALRLWAVRSEFGPDEEEEDAAEENGGTEVGATNDRLTGKPVAVSATTGGANRRRR